MTQADLMDAMGFVDDELLESAARSMEKKPLSPWVPLVVLAACATLIIGIARFNPPDPPTVTTDPTSMNVPSSVTIPSAMTDPPSTTQPPSVTQPPSTTQPPSVTQPPVTIPSINIPDYENALFSAEQIGDLFPATYGTTTYTLEGYPNEALFHIPTLPETGLLDVYKRVEIDTEYRQSDIEQFVDEMLPKVEDMHDILFTEDSSTLTELSYGGYVYSTRTEADTHKIFRAYHRNGFLSFQCTSYDRLPLSINGITLQVTNSQTEDQIMQTVSQVIPYLESAFDMELSAYRIDQDRYDEYEITGALYSMSVWLYAEDQVADQTLEEYGRSYALDYTTGKIFHLQFWTTNDCPPGTVVCLGIEYAELPQPQYQPDTQCRMVSLDEAETLLNNGCVFSTHACPLCMAQQAEVDFSDYDYVSLEYVFGGDDNLAVPFYTFYKRLSVSENGAVQYAKTMVPAIEVSGLKEYFENQTARHPSYSK